MDGIYNNTGYRNTRNRKQILILDVWDHNGETHLGSGGEFSVDLFEPLLIDKQSEVYLDNFISINSNITNITSNSAFILKINEFNINSNVASSANSNTILNSIIIPNEHNDLKNNHSMIVHKAKKFNYICDINPGKIGRISGTITNLSGGPIFHSPTIDAQFTYALTGINSTSLNQGAFPISTGTKAQITSSNTELLTLGGITTATFLGIHQHGTTTLYFSTDFALTWRDRTNDGTIKFLTGGHPSLPDTLTVNHIPATNNPNLLLITDPGRFIAEFSINSRE